MNIQVKLLKSFTQDPSAGSPVGVIENAEHLNAEQMKSVVRHYDLPECVFLQKSERGDIRTRFFTKVQEVNYCGHATLAAFQVFSQSRNGVFLQETNKGILEVKCQDQLISLQQGEAIVRQELLDSYEIASLLSIGTNEIIGPCRIISVGTPKIIVPIRNLDSLFAIKAQLEAIKAYSQKIDACGIYLFTQETLHPNSHFHARQFNPLVGIDEDPITGVAAAALGIYNNIYKLTGNTSCIVEQGQIMKQFGKIHVNASSPVIISGYAVPYAEDEICV